MSILTQQLAILQEKQTLINLYRQYCTQKQIIQGLIIDHSDEYTFIIKINDRALPAGIAIIENQTISKINWDTPEQRALTNRVWQNQNQARIIPPQIDLTSWQSIIQSVQFRYNIVTLHTEDVDGQESYTGQIIDIDEDHLIIQAPKTPTNPHPQKTLLEVDDITKISTDSPQPKNTAPNPAQNKTNQPKSPPK